MVLCERKLDNGDIIRVERLSTKELQVNIEDTVGVIVFAKNLTSGHDALELFYHPYGDRRVNHGYQRVPETVGS